MNMRRAPELRRMAWGDDYPLNGKAAANCLGCSSQWDGKQTAPVSSFAVNRRLRRSVGRRLGVDNRRVPIPTSSVAGPKNSRLDFLRSAFRNWNYRGNQV
jgi:hypothetical protein